MTAAPSNPTMTGTSRPSALAPDSDIIGETWMMAHFTRGMHATCKGPSHRNTCSHIAQHRHPFYVTGGVWIVLAGSARVPSLRPNNPKLLGSAARSDWLHSPSRLLQCRPGGDSSTLNPTMVGTSRPSALAPDCDIIREIVDDGSFYKRHACHLQRAKSPKHLQPYRPA